MDFFNKRKVPQYQKYGLSGPFNKQCNNNGCSVGLVADGVGSAKTSDIGAKIAVEKAGEYCSENINSGMN